MDRNEIHEEMLDDIPSKHDKRKGRFIYEATRPAATQLEKAYEAKKEVEDKLSIENLSGDELEQRIYERTGIERRSATHAIVYLDVEGNGEISEGDIAETESGTQFEAVEDKEIDDEAEVEFQAVEAGENGNVPADQITHLPVTLSGIDLVNNPEASFDGFEAESDEELLERYYERIQTPATSGNKNHYLNWAKEVDGVGEARVFPLWDGDNTVKVVIINADRQPASDELVEDVQEHIDPNSEGKGEGEAPIGAYVTVESADELEINVEFSATLSSGYEEEEALDNVKENITEYLYDIAFEEDFVSYAQIGSIVLNSNGIGDYTDLEVNGGTSNIDIEDEEVAVLGGVEIV
ncbi:baseplate J/gp47 family protein [Salsuginibacillus kocurii]|uniref:baseplate J/gp47 family protein n=1 Tax=Salsuginibacillus kocurii TaxID=427078 RepID=UPI000381D2BA|nr:baseplate J/gp47 family protein [Salsuginibacillus kocurii]